MNKREIRDLSTSDLKKQVDILTSDIDTFEYDWMCSSQHHNEFHDYINDTHDMVKIGGWGILPAQILEQADYTEYTEQLDKWYEENLVRLINENETRNDMIAELELTQKVLDSRTDDIIGNLENVIKDLQHQIKELKSQLNH